MPASLSLAARIKREAARLGFPLAGIVPAGPALTHPFYEHWLEKGYGGEMAYLRRHLDLKRDPRQLEPSARSLILLGHSYMSPGPSAPQRKSHLAGRISRYAWGEDYHQVLRQKLEQLALFIEKTSGNDLRWRAFVDSGPVMEREFAARAGLGWVGRNAMLIHWKHGSWLFLAELLLDLELDYDTPPPPPKWPAREQGQGQEKDRQDSAESSPPALELRESCGSCTACIEACPTSAIVADKTVDARLCISYLTIELKGPIPVDLRPQIGNWVFGCDICQEVCPWNRDVPLSHEPSFRGDGQQAAPSLPALLAMDQEAFRKAFRRTPLWRAKRKGILRNAAIALGNLMGEKSTRNPDQDSPPNSLEASETSVALEALEKALGDPEPLIRGAAAWALGRMKPPASRALLAHALQNESHPAVRKEIAGSLRVKSQFPFATDSHQAESQQTDPP